MAGATTHKFQAPKGTRDFFAPDMAVRRHIEAAWRRASINHGFDEIEGPTFEHLDLYTVKSGPGIVSELFSFRRAGGEVDYALRPEFTPTLARMAADTASSLPRPTKWFCVPTHFRAERPQRGRLREFVQWNVDVIGDDSPRADAEVIAVTLEALRILGLGEDEVRVRIGHRAAVERVLRHHGVADERLPEAIALLDAVAKLPPEEFRRRAVELGVEASGWDEFTRFIGATAPMGDGEGLAALPELEPLAGELEAAGFLGWCDAQPSLARGLAYYTGTVFEVHEASGRERAVAGGGRYDTLIELFGGPSLPAVGCAMGDVVLRLVLEDRGHLASPEAYLPRPDVFVINALEDGADEMHRLVAELRRTGLHVRHSYRATRNVGKLLGEAGRVRARQAVILGREMAEGIVVVKDLESGTQRQVPRDAIAAAIAP
jgi:histidyl-tRNA synthetase